MDVKIVHVQYRVLTQDEYGKIVGRPVNRKEYRKLITGQRSKLVTTDILEDGIDTPGAQTMIMVKWGQDISQWPTRYFVDQNGNWHYMRSDFGSRYFGQANVQRLERVTLKDELLEQLEIAIKNYIATITD